MKFYPYLSAAFNDVATTFVVWILSLNMLVGFLSIQQ